MLSSSRFCAPVEQGEDLVGEVARQDAEKEEAVAIIHRDDQFRDFRRGLVREEFAQLVELPFLDHLQDFGTQ